jgi:glucose/arabinose dehydrogenase
VVTWQQFDTIDNDIITAGDSTVVDACFFSVGPCEPTYDVNLNGRINHVDAILIHQCRLWLIVCPEFTLTEVATGYVQPTSFGFDGNVLYVAEKRGNLYADGVLVHTVQTSTKGEHGLIVYATGGHVFLYYAATDAEGILRSRLSRWDGVAETPIYDFETLDSFAGNHVGGGMRLLNGVLYLGRGEDEVMANSQDDTTTEGKILAIDLASPPVDPLDAVVAKGVRNPFTLATDGTVIYVNDVGGSSFEEINVLETGANYGWPVCEGPCTTAGMTNPLYSYPRDGGSAITGGLFYEGIPDNIDSHYLFGDFVQNEVWLLSGTERRDAFTVSRPVAINAGPGGAYILSFLGTLYRIDAK